MSALLPIILFLSWFAFVLAPQGKKAIDDERNGVPKDKRQRTSILPGFPLMPLFFWGLAWLLDRVISPWGSRSIIESSQRFCAVRSCEGEPLSDQARRPWDFR